MIGNAGVSDRRMSYFVALVEQRSFARASAYCGVTQSALSQQIFKLEREIGAQLLDRTVRPFALTPLGQEVYEHALNILQTYREISNAARRSALGKIGKVRVGIVPTLLYLSEVPTALRRFRAEYPAVQVDLARLDNVDAVNRMLDRHLDVVFSFSRVEDPGIQGVALGEQPFVVALPDSHRLVKRRSIDLAELRGDDFISFPRDAYADSQDDLIHAARELGFSPKVRNVHATFIEHTGFVAAGYGVALVPESMTRYAVTGVKFVQLAGSGLRLSTWLYWRSESSEPSVRQFIESVSASLNGAADE